MRCDALGKKSRWLDAILGEANVQATIEPWYESPKIRRLKQHSARSPGQPMEWENVGAIHTPLQ